MDGEVAVALGNWFRPKAPGFHRFPPDGIGRQKPKSPGFPGPFGLSRTSLDHHLVDTVAKNSNRGGGAFRGRPDRALKGSGLPRNRRESRTLAPAGDESQPYRRSPWRRPNDRNQSPALDQVALTRNVKTNGFGQQRPFSHPVEPVIRFFGGRLNFGQAQKGGKIHQSAMRIT